MKKKRFKVLKRHLRYKKYDQLKIDRINNSFNNSYYLIKSHRSIESLFRILLFKIKEYRKAISQAQKEISSNSSRHLSEYSIKDFLAFTIAGKCKKNYSFGTSHKLLIKYHPKMISNLNKLGVIGMSSLDECLKW